CDVNNGPTPLYCNIVAVHGNGTMIVDWAVEAWFNECEIMQGVLSNRWTMSHDIDTDFWTTRTTEGVAIFRADVLFGSLGNFQVADNYRAL
ncbi:hypothetical protein U2063_15335, partial [Listeria monocytogenes]|uniref:hypothetical protein n=1 Tax=Listeria monocytogenes TaxID=1639 RepID=UPI002FDC07ED